MRWLLAMQWTIECKQLLDFQRPIIESHVSDAAAPRLASPEHLQRTATVAPAAANEQDRQTEIHLQVIMSTFE